MLTHKHMHTHTDVRETVGDRQNREKFDQSVCRKHFLAKGDILQHPSEGQRYSCETT